MGNNGRQSGRVKLLPTPLSWRAEFDIDKAREGIRMFLDSMTIDGKSVRDYNPEMYENTPRRFVDVYRRAFNPGVLHQFTDRIWIADSPLDKESGNLIALYRQPLVSFCEHHLMPILLELSVGYVPGDKILGVSKIRQLAYWVVSKPITSEDAVDEFVQTVMHKAGARGAGMVLNGIHTCLAVKANVPKQYATVTSLAGELKQEPLASTFLRGAGL